ncbi:uncharacterized protein SPSC_01709 [Sporisorium scitamineum]|uniref:Effector family protein Eff1 n=1 Tax=Sporisorium scitamineum TaxID=49012 RepID=A0A0F7SB15_9BASI|nr:uncharacterized protein SPSC_01709 [Sporisorium scitamineum]CDW98035.1 hypothetical protein [Sporisorium scitamineum]
MKLLYLISFAALVGLSYQGFWEQLANLSQEEAVNFLTITNLQNTEGGTGAEMLSQHATSGHTGSSNNVYQHSLAPSSSNYHGPAVHGQAVPFMLGHRMIHLPADNQHLPYTPADVPLSTEQRQQQQQSVLGHRQPASAPAINALPVLTTDLLREIPPLTLQQRKDILQKAFDALKPPSQKMFVNLQPFADDALLERLVLEFTKSRAQLRSFGPGLVMQPRSKIAVPWGHEGKMNLNFRSKHQLFVLRYVSDLPSKESRSVFQFVGILELKQENAKAISHLQALKTSRFEPRAIGKDTFVNYRPITPLKV